MEARTAAVQNGRIQSVITSTALLYGMQLLTMFVPLLYLPRLATLLGPVDFGILMLALAIVGYIYNVVDYGYGLVGSRYVSINNSNLSALDRYLTAALCTRLMLFVCMAVIVVPVVAIFAREKLAVTCCLAMLLPLGNVVLVTWFYQGVGKLAYATSVLVMARLVAILPLFLMRSNVNELYWAAFFITIPSLVAGIVLLMNLHRCGYLRELKLYPGDVAMHLHEGKSVFIASVSTSIYTQGAMITVGIIATPAAVSIYAIGDKIRAAVVALIGPISQVIYPRMTTWMNDGKKGSSYFKFALIFQVGGIAAICIILLLSLPIIVQKAFGSQYMGAIKVAQILVVTPIFVALDNVLGVLYLMPRRMDVALKAIHGTVAAFALPAFIATSILSGPNGVALAVLFAACVVPLLMLFRIMQARKS